MHSTITRETIIKTLTGWKHDKENWLSPRYIRIHSRRFEETIKLIPNLPPGSKMLDIGSCYEFAILLKEFFLFDQILHGFDTKIRHQGEAIRKEVTTLRHPERKIHYSFPIFLFDLEIERYPFVDESFDFILCCEVLEHLPTDPMNMMAEINRILKNEGILLLTTPNIASSGSLAKMVRGASPYQYGYYFHKGWFDRHNREYTPAEIKMLAEAAGFEILQLTTKQVWNFDPEFVPSTLLKIAVNLTANKHLLHDDIFVLARKVSGVRVRYPKFLYQRKNGN